MSSYVTLPYATLRLVLWRYVTLRYVTSGYVQYVALRYVRATSRSMGIHVNENSYRWSIRKQILAFHTFGHKHIEKKQTIASDSTEIRSEGPHNCLLHYSLAQTLESMNSLGHKGSPEYWAVFTEVRSRRYRQALYRRLQRDHILNKYKSTRVYIRKHTHVQKKCIYTTNRSANRWVYILQSEWSGHKGKSFKPVWNNRSQANTTSVHHPQNFIYPSASRSRPTQMRSHMYIYIHIHV